MFTGIIEEIGRVHTKKCLLHSISFCIEANDIMQDISLGDSIAVNGVCLTVTSIAKNKFTCDVMHQSLNHSCLGKLKSGSAVNLERALKINARLGGHLVSGHIDGVGIILTIQTDDHAIWIQIKPPSFILSKIIDKGSIAIDGISLTVAKLEKDSFWVCMIPHTISMTTLSFHQVGDHVNLENDCISKYIEKLLNQQTSIQNQKESNNISRGFLTKYGFLGE